MLFTTFISVTDFLNEATMLWVKNQKLRANGTFDVVDYNNDKSIKDSDVFLNINDFFSEDGTGPFINEVIESVCEEMRKYEESCKEHNYKSHFYMYECDEDFSASSIKFVRLLKNKQ